MSTEEGRTGITAPREARRQIEATDHEIDALVYQLYGLTEEEIAVVEGRERPQTPTPV